jgi:hypothetical protein
LFSPGLSDEQHSDLAADESSTGNPEDGFELVSHKRNRNQRPKQENGTVWSGTHIRELYNGSQTANQATRTRVSPNSTNAPSKNLSAKGSSQDGAVEEQDTSNHSSDSAFAENVSIH